MWDFGNPDPQRRNIVVHETTGLPQSFVKRHVYGRPGTYTVAVAVQAQPGPYLQQNKCFDIVQETIVLFFCYSGSFSMIIIMIIIVTKL